MFKSRQQNSNIESRVGIITVIVTVLLGTLYGTVYATTAPVLMLNGDASVTAEAGLPYTDLGATAEDFEDGDITGAITTTGVLSVNVNMLGAYIVQYEVEDSDGNLAIPLTRTVTVTDTLPPTLTLAGEMNMSISAGSVFSDPGATAEDIFEGDLTADIMVSGEVTTAVPGNYTLTYAVEDSSGNQSTVERYVNVSDYQIFLPLTNRPLNGSVGFSNGRSRGVTSFESAATLDFSGLGFASAPDEVHVWKAGESEPSSWESYSESGVSVALDSSVVGAQEFYVRFRTNGSQTDRLFFRLFYLPNGDFADSALPTGWSLTENGLGSSHNGLTGEYTLGDAAISCTSVPFPAATVLQLLVNLPADDGYTLRVEGAIFTHDKMPNASLDLWDDFEVGINGATAQRFGYQGSDLLNCDTQRQVDLDASFLLDSYSGITTFTFENHSRLDQFYNTYTEIDAIWIESGN